MGKFRIMPHMRLQEWVAEDQGYFADDGLDYEFVRSDGLSRRDSSVQAAEETSPAIVKQGAFESMEVGRACNVSAACYWAVNMAASAQHGRMWGHAYSVTPCGIMIPADSPIKRAEDLAGVEVGVGYHSGSHFSTVQTLTKSLPMDSIKLRFIGGPWDRVDLLLERRIQAATVFGTQKDVLEQQGFRKVVDATFMIGFLIQPGTASEDVERYFRALRRAQQDIDLEPEQFRHYYLHEMPEKYRPMIDVRAFSSGERIVFEPYTQQMYEQTHRWMEEHNFFDASQTGSAGFAQAVLV